MSQKKIKLLEEGGIRSQQYKVLKDLGDFNRNKQNNKKLSDNERALAISAISDFAKNIEIMDWNLIAFHSHNYDPGL